MKSTTQEHSFLLAKPPGITNVSQICLRIEGSQTSSSGDVSTIAGGTTCRVPEPEVVMDVPSWWEPVTVPVWQPVKNGAIARDLLAAHVTVQSDTPGNGELTRNTLVCFPDWTAEAPLDVVTEALSRLRGKAEMIAVIAVLPVGAFDQRPEEIERRLKSQKSTFPVQLMVTEDDEGGWSRTFAPTKTPSVYLTRFGRTLT